MIATEPATTRWARLARRLGLDRNPLRRRIDHAHTCIMAGLLAAFLIGAPLSAILGSHLERAAGQRVWQAQQTWQRVPAVLLQSAQPDPYVVYGSALTAWVRARWTAPGGSAHTGEIPVSADKPAGSTVRVWVDSTGHAMGTPLSRGQINSRVLAAAVFAPLGIALLLLTTAVVASVVLEHRRLREWETAWVSIERQWSRRS